MVFWSIVIAVVAVVLLLGWRADRRGTRFRIIRRNGAAESDLARGQSEVHNRAYQSPWDNGV